MNKSQIAVVICGLGLLGACGKSDSVPSQADKKQTQMSGYSCDSLTEAVLSENGSSSGQVATTLVYATQDLPQIDTDLIEACLTQNLNIDCEPQEACTITRKEK